MKRKKQERRIKKLNEESKEKRRERERKRVRRKEEKEIIKPALSVKNDRNKNCASK